MYFVFTFKICNKNVKKTQIKLDIVMVTWFNTGLFALGICLIFYSFVILYWYHYSFTNT